MVLVDVVPSAQRLERVAHEGRHVEAVLREHGEVCASASLYLLNEYN